MRSASAALAIVLVLAVSSLACGGGGDGSSATPSSQSSSAPVTIMRRPTWWTPWANSPEALFFQNDVVVGRVTGVSLPFDPTIRLYTVYSVEVTDVVRGQNVHPGDVVNVGQSGGMWRDVAYQDEGDSLLQEGETYLLDMSKTSLFAQDVGVDGYYISRPFGQFAVEEDGTLRAKDSMWSGLPAVKAIAGRPLADVRTELMAMPEPTPIPADTLRDDLNTVPLPAAARPGDTSIMEDLAVQEVFTTFDTASAVYDFYEQELGKDGWTAETARPIAKVPSYWSFARGHVRLMLAVSGAKDASPGEFTWQVLLQPVWFPGFDVTGIPSVCSTSDVLVTFVPRSSFCGHP